MNGDVVGVFIGPVGEQVSLAVDQVTVGFPGIEGDRHAGITMPSNGHTGRYPRGEEIRNSRQVTLVSIEELDEVAAGIGVPLIRPEWLSANLALQGIPGLTRLPPYTRLSFPGGAVLVVAGENNPCKIPGRVVQSQYPEKQLAPQAFVEAARGRRGLIGWVEHPGVIRPGDVIKVE